ncbi:MAG: YebC/PmpR family DNA-binding transcriptional regulator [Planctomycetota bacterium]|jgi:YebC/PmpR family DNA-binding regulatory protein
MAGHSHWAGIKYKKALADAKKGKIFSKIARRLTLAARTGGGDPDSNLELRYAIDDARSANMPKDNIERAVNKGLGNLPGSTFEHVVYEGYGPGGVAIMVEALTDNRNRTASEVRKIFDRNGGNLGESGCVSWMFERKGSIIVDAEDVSEDDLLLAVMDAGAENMERAGDIFEITTEAADLRRAKDALQEAGFDIKKVEPKNVPKSIVDLDSQRGRKILRLLEILDDHDDVETVSANFNVPEEVMAEIAEG